MSFITEILNRPTISEISNYLLYGAAVTENKQEDYYTRLKNAFMNCEITLNRYDNDKESALYQAVYDLLSEHEKVYMEIGFQSGLLLMNDAIKHQNRIKNTEETKNVLHD